MLLMSDYASEFWFVFRIRILPFQDANIRQFFLLLTKGTGTVVFKDNKLIRSHKTLEIKVFLNIFACRWKDPKGQRKLMDPTTDPDPVPEHRLFYLALCFFFCLKPILFPSWIPFNIRTWRRAKTPAEAMCSEVLTGWNPTKGICMEHSNPKMKKELYATYTRYNKNNSFRLLLLKKEFLSTVGYIFWGLIFSLIPVLKRYRYCPPPGPAKLFQRIRFHNTATISQTTTVAMTLIKNRFAGAH